MIALSLFSTADAYSENGTRRQPGTVRVQLIVSNAAVILQLAENDQTGNNFTANDEEVYVQGGYTINRLTAGARVRSATPGLPAIVNMTLLQRSDIP